MVRGPAAVLGLLAAAQAYVFVAPELPIVTPVDLSIVLACAVGAAAVVACASAVPPLSDVPPLLWLVVLGAGILITALNVSDVGAGATPIETLGYAGIGAVFAAGLLSPSLAIGLPLFVAVVDVVSTLGGGPSETLANAGTTRPGDPLSLELPDWGTGLPAGRLGISDAVFIGVFLVYARKFGLRPRATAVGLWVASVAAVALKVWLDTAIPVLPLMAAAYFLVNADRIPALVRRATAS
ncbi:hypothetical protein FSW04_04835 [Baekduia soli]|uniref:Uncharacterized protein n=1 Tax=Baekduia soli TaxID=496014 RepID=A0A5B8U1Z9_9ACTN|nr:hypothetical protein [Baekduia soli]QEC46980.1 hypothetical protein FSW04_04835 [Baekduia soli]